MGCGCNREPKPKCTPRVLEIEKPEEKVLFHKVVLPASAGDDTTNPPTPGKYENVLLEYEANGHLYLYSSDGIPTQIPAASDINEDFNTLNNRPSYAGVAMTSNTNIPDVTAAVAAEASARGDADINLQSQIDAVVASSDVKDVVGTKAALDAYDTTSLGNNDIIKVLQDETQNDATTYYRWSTTTSSFSLIGEEGPYYTKSASDIIFNTKADKSTTYTKTEVNSLLAAKQGTLTAGTNIQISNNTISATDTTYTAGSGLTLTGTTFSVNTGTIATKNYVDTSLANYTPTASLSTVATTGSYSDLTNKLAAGDGIEIDGNNNIDIANIEQYAHFFDTVADMKAATNLSDGDYARTLGFYAKNDGGDALYKIREVTNQDVVDGQQIIRMNDASLVAELIKTDPINVKQCGVHGDGTTDDSSLIQALIDNNPHSTLWFPEGEYLITEPLVIKSGNNYQVNLKLNDNAQIKASGSVQHLITIGVETGSTYNRYLPGSEVMIEGGQWFGDNVTVSVFRLNARQKQTTLRNLKIRNVQPNTIGLHLEPNGGDISSDTIVDNISIQGTGSDYNIIGMKIDGYDNKFDRVFIQRCKIGIQITGGGNFINNCHILGSWRASTVTASIFNDTIGVDCQNQTQWFTNLYIDTMATGIKVQGGSYIKVQGFMVFFWTTPSTGGIIQVIHFADNHEYTHVFLEGGQINFPSGNNTLYGCRCTTQNQEEYLLYHQQLKIVNVKLLNPKFITNQTDRMLDIHFQCENTPNFYPWTLTMTANAYYPIAYVSGVSKIMLRMANDQIIEAVVNANTPALSVTNIHNGAHAGTLTLALVDGRNSVTGTSCKILAVKSNASGSFNPSIVRLSPLWNDRISTCVDFLDKEPLVNPTVNVEKSFNP